MVVKTKDGTEQTVHFVDKTAVWGADKTAAGAKDTFKGLSEGSEVAVHYSENGGENTRPRFWTVGRLLSEVRCGFPIAIRWRIWSRREETWKKWKTVPHFVHSARNDGVNWG
jgi:hypothetical protein